MSADSAMRGSKVSWHEGELPDLPVAQVYGFLFDAGGRLLLIKLGGTYTLPGGKPEQGEELEQTLRRECLEEAQTEINAVQVLGFQRVEGDEVHWDGTPYAQVRMVGRIVRMHPAAVDPATGHEYERHMVEPHDAPKLLNWGEPGFQQVRAAIRIAQSTELIT